ncbi:hypothetical protein DPEC_G00058090 [Dallia pectoralis]|uniref:Uncharacterized protein n=1 Tax=Dallia pectoralis TaxID=75939 RepID=A0ACC2H604_DALPE|nr:hypothetical protein DPEC_G00058090 [Dallia pectoralis]
MSLSLVVIISLIHLFLVSGQKMDQEISFTRTKGQSVSFSCKNTDQCVSYIFWYQKKEHEPFIVVLNIAKKTCKLDASFNHPDKDDFSATKKETNCDLKIQQRKHLLFDKRVFTVYYVKIFGTGTRLYVTEKHQSIQKPEVYTSPVSTPEPNGKTTMLCLARDMFPDLVKISWKIEDRSGQKVDVPKGEGEVLEQTEKGLTTSMIIIDKEKIHKNKYTCSVMHERGIQDVGMKQDSFQSMTSLNLASLTYTVMIVKTLVYCCGLTILIQLRNMGCKPRSM